MTLKATSDPSLFRRAALAQSAAKAIALALLILGSIVFLMPFWVSLSMSLKSPAEIAATSVWSPPHQVTLDNFKTVLSNPDVNFYQLLWNTIVIAGLSTLGVVFSASLVAYPFARLRFRGRERLFILMLSTMMLPSIVILIPSYLMFKEVHWVDTNLPLIVPAFFGGGAFNIFLMRQFYMGIPRELDEAALIDGASHFTIWRRVLVPLSKPALVTVGIFNFIFAWRDFLNPLVYLNEVQKQTLEVGLTSYSALQQEKYNLLMAGSVLVMVPLILIFLVGQRYFVKGIVMTGIK